MTQQPTPGWYPDPQDPSRNLYWDGSAWHRNMPPPPVVPPPPAAKKKPSGCMVALITAMALGLGGLILLGILVGGTDSGNNTGSGNSGSSKVSAERIERLIISACQDSARDRLKDPDGAKFDDDWKAQLVTGPAAQQSSLKGYSPAGHKLYTATGSLNAKNGFGGYTGNQPVFCDAYYTPDDETAHAHAVPLS